MVSLHIIMFLNINIMHVDLNETDGDYKILYATTLFK
ncbi:hypothetical protein G893_03411 [Escherichia coli KOEGE 71 (186a)]|nr:hypothetical protein G893_03411 [Escherichia coli KOEGE 71 (186a)]